MPRLSVSTYFSWSYCGHRAHTPLPSAFPALVRPWTKRLWPGPGHFDAGGLSLVLSLPPAPGPLPPPRHTWLRAASPAVRGWMPTLTNRAASRTSWPPWRPKTRTAQLPTAWGTAGLSRRGLRSREHARWHLTWREGSCPCRKGELTCHLEEATHTAPLVWLAGPQWSLNTCPSQTLRWVRGFHSYFIYRHVWEMIKTRIWRLKPKSEDLQPQSTDFWWQTWIFCSWCDRWLHSREGHKRRENRSAVLMRAVVMTW